MYYVVYGLFYLLSLLPMRVLYFISDGIHFLVYRVFGYRRKVVMANLQIAFPGKTQQERAVIARQFYRNFIDSFMEMIKLFSASEAFLKKRFTMNTELVEQLYQSGRSCQVHLGHTFNWEWGQLVLNSNSAYKVLVVYMPLSNKIFERLIYRLRTRNGSVLLPATSMKSAMALHEDSQYLVGLVADQNPGKLGSAWWMNFFGKPTAFVSGPEKAARSRNIPVVFATIEKVKRGYYHAIFELAAEEPLALKEGELTLQYRDYLEQVIRKNPSMWLWSHRRWKHAWKPEYRDQWIDIPGAPLQA
jgi:Kdo2-lipid IVA lauroyltransferase/acyltransferase